MSIEHALGSLSPTHTPAHRCTATVGVCVLSTLGVIVVVVVVAVAKCVW